MTAISLMLGDCLECMHEIPSGSVDMVLSDPPYGTTACKWDSVIPFEPMWEQVRRVTKPNGAVVMTSTQPFTSALVMSNPKEFRYEWFWDKVSVTGFANAKKQPLRHIESCLVFYRKPPIYNPQGLVEVNKKRRNSDSDGGATLKGEHLSNGKGDLRTGGLERTQKFTGYPKHLLKLPRERGNHPTQKPVALMGYLIRTYTNEGETVLDFTMGSGTTGVAAKNLGRSFIGIELDEKYFHVAERRIQEA